MSDCYRLYVQRRKPPPDHFRDVALRPHIDARLHVVPPHLSHARTVRIKRSSSSAYCGYSSVHHFAATFMLFNSKDPRSADESASVHSSSSSSDDDKELEALGYVPSFKREFSNLATVRVVCTVLSMHQTDVECNPRLVSLSA